MGVSEFWRMGEVVTLLSPETPNLPIAKAIKVILMFFPARCKVGWLVASVFAWTFSAIHGVDPASTFM